MPSCARMSAIEGLTSCALAAAAQTSAMLDSSASSVTLWANQTDRRTMRIILFILLLAMAAIPARPSLAHEFWIEPLKYQVPTGERIEANLKNGQDFEGINLSYLDRRFLRFDQLTGGMITPLPGRAGDLPAVQIDAAPEGLLVLAYESRLSRITYKEWEKFDAFATHKDFPDIRARHDARGLPETDFTEGYSRYPKVLIGVGAAEGADRAFGMETEFVALDNPYRAGFTGPLPVQLLYRGAPRGDAQVEIFQRAADGGVSIDIVRTDADGKALIPVRPGVEYLLDAVVLRVPDPALAEAEGIVWETLWATLTFAMPE
jgi:uncharacterized GH25 family protein